MKKILVVLLALVFAAALLPACGGGGGSGGGGSSWISAGLARSVDKQFGPVTLGANGAKKKGEVIPATLSNDQDGGTHQVKALKGKVNKVVVSDVVRQLDVGQIMGPIPNWNPLPGKSADLVSKISTLASAHSVDNNPCENDSDMDGVPDVKEARCDLVTDPGCTGLCDDPAQVKCTGSGKTFNIKFSDCVQVSTSTTWEVTDFSTDTTTGTCTGTWQIQCNTAINTQIVRPFTTWTTTTTNTNWFFNAGPASTATTTWTTYTDCGSSVVHQGTSSTTTSTAKFVTSSTCGLPIEITDCTTPTYTDVSPATTWMTTTWTTGTTITTSTADIWDGGVALNYGVSNVDEQLYHTRYNNLTMVWDADGAAGGFDTVDNAAFVTISGQRMEYRVVDPFGFPTSGTTARYKNGGNVPGYSPGPDGMVIWQEHIKIDHDGKDGTVFPTGSYATKSGVDAEDGQFEFSGGSAIVQVLGAAWLSGDTTGDVYEISFFDKDNPGDYLCETAHGTPCSVQVDINYAARTYDVLTSDCEDVKLDTGIKY